MIEKFPSEFLDFMLTKEKPLTKVWEVMSKSQYSSLGVIKWLPAWRQYCFFPEKETIWSNNCLNDVVVFLNTKNHEHQMEVKNRKVKA